MCEYAARLIAWLDHELTEPEAVEVERHVRHCQECGRAIRSYEEVSGVFLEGYLSAMPATSAAHPWRWIGISGLAAAAAAIALALLLTYPHAESLRAAPAPVHAPAIAFEKTPPTVEAHAQRVRNSRPVSEPWFARGPAVEVALPADALFPPGAVPAGFSFIADVRPQP